MRKKVAKIRFFPLCFVLVFAVAGEHAWAQSYTQRELQAVEKPDEGKIRELREQEISQLRIALGRRQGKNRMAELYYRLAEIYLETYRAAFILEGRAHENRLERGESEKTIDRGYSKPFLQKGIQASREILSNGIAYEKLDRVYYFLAFNYGELGQHKEAAKYHEMITQKFPDSPFVAESYRELGDYYFENKEYRKAQAYYEQALRKSENNEKDRPRLLHKLAWTHYRIKNYDGAVTTMKEAVDAANRSGEKLVSLKDEALKDLAIFMTESGRVEEAVQFFQKVAGDKTFYPKALERLGKQYERNVEPAKAMQVYEALLRTAPDSDAAFRTQVKLIDLDLRQKKHAAVIARANQLDIRRGFESEDAETQVSAQNVKAMIRRTATEHHDRFRKKSDRGDLTTAEAYYSAYLGGFLAKLSSGEDSEKIALETSEIKMYLAEVKRELGKSQEASALYRQVIESKDKRYAKEAGALWTASLAEAIKKSSQSQVKFSSPSQLESDFVAAADQLQEALGDTPEGRDAAVRAAQVQAGYKDTQNDAIDRCRKIIKNRPHSPQAVTAARLWLQIESDRYTQSANKDDDDLRETMEKIRANPELMSADGAFGQNKLRTALADEDVRLKIKSITQSETSENYKDAAMGYEQLAQSNSNRELSEKAFQNAVNTYSKAGDAVNAERVLFLWHRKYPAPVAGTKGDRILDSGRALATHYLIVGDFETAIRLFERFGRELKDAASLETAAKLSEGVADRPRANRLWSEYIERYRDPSPESRNWIILKQLAMSLEAAGEDSQALKVYQQCLNGPADLAAESAARLGDFFIRNKDIAQAKTYYRRVAGNAPEKKTAPGKGAKVAKAPKQKPAAKGQSEKSGSGPYTGPYVGYARYRLAEIQERELTANMEVLALPEAQLKKALAQRLSQMESLNQIYGFVQEAGGPWAVAAVDRFTTWAEKFAQEIDQIAPPEKASPESAQKFKAQLKTISDPIRAKTLANRREIYNQALQAEIFSPVLPMIGDKLADAKISDAFRAQGVRGKFRLAGIAANGGEDGMKTALQKTRDRLLKVPADTAAWVDYGNLMWGSDKPLLAKIFYEKAASLNPRSSAALNNKAVVILSHNEEDWLQAWEGNQLLQQSIQSDPLFTPSKANRAMLLNYYRIFSKAKPLWEQVLVKANQSAEFYDGLATAQQGSGNPVSAEAEFAKATELGSPKKRFANLYHQAVRVMQQNTNMSAGDRGEKCVDLLEDIDLEKVQGFEKSSYEHLMGVCKTWMQTAKK